MNPLLDGSTEYRNALAVISTAQEAVRQGVAALQIAAQNMLDEAGVTPGFTVTYRAFGHSVTRNWKLRDTKVNAYIDSGGYFGHYNAAGATVSADPLNKQGVRSYATGITGIPVSEIIKQWNAAHASN